jgi:predicted dinucleotide-binding enzyme
MKITILGSGNIGGTLGKKWAAAGHSVTYATRDPGSLKLAALQAGSKNIRAGSYAQALPDAEVILFAIPWGTVAEVAKTQAAHLDGKILIDATNNFGGSVINNLEALQRAAPKARIFRAFNSLGWEVFAQPHVGGLQADMFFCGPEGAERKLVAGLIEASGVRPICVGDNATVRLVDDMGLLWVSLVLRQGWSRHTAFKALTE